MTVLSDELELSIPDRKLRHECLTDGALRATELSTAHLDALPSHDLIPGESRNFLRGAVETEDPHPGIAYEDPVGNAIEESLDQVGVRRGREGNSGVFGGTLDRRQKIPKALIPGDDLLHGSMVSRTALRFNRLELCAGAAEPSEWA